ncbi:MAG TPA: hypothetical protein VNW04_11135 [Puia sp.]|nr:hypothetical protein [Puia sp.]
MYKLQTFSLLFMALAGRAQDKKALDSVDKIIINSIIKPAEQAAGDQAPNWAALEAQIKASYSDVQTDRAVTKAKIFYYWSKDWPQFSTALVHYTDVYEDKEDFKLMDKNAKMVVDHSTNLRDWKAALTWVQHAADKEPGNAEYKATVDALKAKINGQ